MKPRPGELTEGQRVYNYRQSHAQRVVENAFGVLVARWRIFLTPIKAAVESVEKYVKGTVVLHNYLIQTENAKYLPVGFVDSDCRNMDIKEGHRREIINIRGSRQGSDATKIRDSLKDFVNSDAGALRWQLDHVRRT